VRKRIGEGIFCEVFRTRIMGGGTHVENGGKKKQMKFGRGEAQPMENQKNQKTKNLEGKIWAETTGEKEKTSKIN